MFGWFKKQKPKKKYLFGHDITGYHYLGFTKLYVHETGNPSVVLEYAYVYFFCEEMDYDNRMYVLSGDTHRDFSTHSFMREAVATWMIGEKSLSYPVITQPSRFLEKYMKDTYSEVWDGPDNKWVTRKEHIVKPEVTDQEDNVIKLSFPSTKKDVDNTTTI